MRIALFADIHANKEAFTACLAHARGQGAARFVFLGDLVGYGADPGFVVDAVQALAQAGAVCVLGNHDAAIGHPSSSMNAAALAAIDWTRNELGAGQRAFLASLPLQAAEDDRLYVHATPKHPGAWTYIRDGEDAAAALQATPARAVFCGHLHKPGLFGVTAAGKLASFTPQSSSPVPLTRPRRWLARLGAVGQPRDGNPAAAYCLLDDAANEIRFCRVPYDVAKAAAKIRAAGLPDRLATRLETGS